MEAIYIDHMGDDLRVTNAARVSFSKESKEFTWRENVEKGSDEGLISYLADHNHWTPFSHCQITLREKVPIFVARQRFKHMVGFTYNEVSRRYVDDTPEFYIPDVWRSRPNGSVKQGSGENISGPALGVIESEYEIALDKIREVYNELLRQGAAPEQARMILPQSMYTEYYVTGSLAAWARAYKLRIDPHAQQEIRELAEMWDKVIEPLFPVSWGALIN